MTNSEAKEINTLIANIWEQLTLNEKALENNTPFQTDGLEDKVKNVCGKVTALPREKAIAFEPELTKMIEFLTDLSTRMQARQITLSHEATSLNQRQKAMNAYKQSDGLKNKPSSDGNSSESQ